MNGRGVSTQHGGRARRRRGREIQQSGRRLQARTHLNHVALLELHDLGTLRAQLARHDNLATLRALLHDEADDTVRRAPHRETAEKLELQGLGLRLRAEAAVLDALGVQLDASLGELEALLHNRRKLANALALLAEHLLRVSRADDNLPPERRVAHLDTGVPVLSELALEELVELGVEHAVGHALALLRDLLGGHRDTVRRLELIHAPPQQATTHKPRRQGPGKPGRTP
jgi:hypothetical protein